MSLSVPVKEGFSGICRTQNKANVQVDALMRRKTAKSKSSSLLNSVDGLGQAGADTDTAELPGPVRVFGIHALQ